jgi:hypothetical protein
MSRFLLGNDRGAAEAARRRNSAPRRELDTIVLGELATRLGAGMPDAPSMA